MGIIDRNILIYSPAPCLEQVQQVYRTYLHALTHQGCMLPPSEMVPAQFVGHVAYMLGDSVADAAKQASMSRQGLSKALTALDASVRAETAPIELSGLKWDLKYELKYMMAEFSTHYGDHLLQITPEEHELTVIAYRDAAYMSTRYDDWPAISAILGHSPKVWRKQVKWLIKENPLGFTFG